MSDPRVRILALSLVVAIPGFAVAAAPAAGVSTPERFHFVLSGWNAGADGRQVNNGSNFTDDIGDELDVGGPEIGRDNQFIVRGVRYGMVLEHSNVVVSNPDGQTTFGGGRVTAEATQRFSRVQFTAAIVNRRHFDLDLLLGVLGYRVDLGGRSQGQFIPVWGLAPGLRLAGDRVLARAELVSGGFASSNKNIDSTFRSWNAVVDYYPFQRVRFLGFRGGYVATNVDSDRVQPGNSYHLRFRGPVFGAIFRF